jgi:alcohol dehydrogenase class IV
VIALGGGSPMDVGKALRLLIKRLTCNLRSLISRPTGQGCRP